MDTELQRPQDCSKSWASLTLRFFLSPENKLNPYSLSWQVLAISEVPPYMCTKAPDPWAATAIQTFLFFVTNTPHNSGPSRWPDLKAGGPRLGTSAMALTNRMWMTGGNKLTRDALVCELDGGDKDHLLQQLGRAERAKFFVLGFTRYHPEWNSNEWDKATVVFLTKEIHVSLQNASVRWEMKFHVRPCLHHRNCCLTCSQTFPPTPHQTATLPLGRVLTVPVLLTDWWSTVVWAPEWLNTSWLSCAFPSYISWKKNIKHYTECLLHLDWKFFLGQRWTYLLYMCTRLGFCYPCCRGRHGQEQDGRER